MVSAAAALQAAFEVADGTRRADLAIQNCRLVNVFTGRIEATTILIAGSLIASIDPQPDVDATTLLDAHGQFALPGLLDGHMHVEATLLPPAELARIVVPRGVTSLFADLHEVANVLGRRGIDLLLETTATGPLRIFLQATTYLPDADLHELLAADATTSLGETGLQRLRRNPPRYFQLAARARAARRGINGHAAGVDARSLALLAAAGQRDDHEALSAKEGEARARLGMRVLVREGSTERNLEALIPLALDRRVDPRMLLFCTDDKHVGDVLAEGHIDHNLRRAIELGLEPLTALRIATLNCAEHFGLGDRLGAVAPGYLADVVLVDNLDRPRARTVIADGRLAARDGEALWPLQAPAWPEWACVTVRLPRVLQAADFTLPPPNGQSDVSVKVIGVVENQIVNRADQAKLIVVQGDCRSEPQQDVLKIALIERHGGSGRIGLAFVRGFGLQSGAIGSSVAHDHHNLVVVGASEGDMAVCANALAEQQGGFVVVRDGVIVERLPLPIGGLMSDRPAHVVARGLEKVEAAAHALGCQLRAPFMTLSFVSLPSVPAYGLSDKGLIDARTGQVVSVFL